MAKGFKTGGRTKGTPNKKMSKAHQEAARQAAGEVLKAGSVRKLAKDVLEDYMFAFNAMAARHQNKIAEAFQRNEKPQAEDLAGFKEWGTLAVETGRHLAQFQSPKFKAVAVIAAPPGVQPEANGRFPANTPIDHVRDPLVIARHYSEIVRVIR